MSDFSPEVVKAAARNAVASFTAGEKDKFTERSPDEHETKVMGCVVRVFLDGRGGVIVRVIDANGRHWFPEIAA